jgi:hypothetical protein
MKRNLLLTCLLLAMVIGPATTPAQAQNDLFIEGYAFLDMDGDGQRQVEEPGIGGVTVTVTPSGNPTPLTAITDLLGYYLVESLAPGAYLVEAQPPAGYLCVRCQVQVDLLADGSTELAEVLSIPVNLALALVVPWTPTPTQTPTDTPTETPTELPTPTETPLPTDTAMPLPTRTPAPTATPGNPVITFYASPETTRFPGDCATLYWWVDRATEVFLILPSGQIGVEGSGQHQVCPQATTTYRLKVNGANGTQEVVEAQVTILPPPTRTPVPPPRVKPTRQPLPTATATAVITATATLTPTLTPEPTWTPLSTVTPTIDPLLAGLPVRWGTIALPIPADMDGH